MKTFVIRTLDRLGLLDVVLDARATARRRLRDWRSERAVPPAHDPDPGQRTIRAADAWVLATVRDRYSPEDLAEQTLSLVTTRLSGLAFAQIPSNTRGRTRIVVDADPSDVVRLIGDEDRLTLATVDANDSTSVRLLDTARTTSLRRTRAGRFLIASVAICDERATAVKLFEHGCEIDTGIRSVRSPDFRPSAPTPHLDVVRRDAIPSLHDEARAMWSIRMTPPPFPIDAVVTWVDGADPEWIARRQRWQTAGEHTDEASVARFHDFGTLRFVLRSIDTFAPYVRTIYLVTDGQRPAFLAGDDQRVLLVRHEEIFADPENLPTFNSHAIESQLHRIGGLAEHYLYFNDDVLLGRPTHWSDFFTAVGAARFATSIAGVPAGGAAARSSLDWAALNTQRLLHEHLGWAPMRKIKHTPHAQRRSVHQRMEEIFRDDHRRTAASRFRSVTDISFAAQLHHRFAEASGLAVEGEFDYDYVNLARRDASRLLGRLLSHPPMTFCLNDAGMSLDQRRMLRGHIEETLEDLLPFRAPWEAPESSS